VVIDPLAERRSKVEVVEQALGREVRVGGPAVLLVDGGVRRDPMEVVAERPRGRGVDPLEDRLVNRELADAFEVRVQGNRSAVASPSISTWTQRKPRYPNLGSQVKPVTGASRLRVSSCASPATRTFSQVTDPSGARCSPDRTRSLAPVAPVTRRRTRPVMIWPKS
jgi:hypothetical protein